MQAFLSHSSQDKDFVLQVYDALEPGSVWLDRVEIEWGQTLLDRIEDGIERASDFVLFWSEAAGASEWVKFEASEAAGASEWVKFVWPSLKCFSDERSGLG